MSDRLFPDRQCCKSCRQGLGRTVGTTVLFGLYCSPGCAGIAMPAQRADDALRECRTQRNGRWEFKRRYRSAGEIPDRLRSDPSTNWYWCAHCGHLHIGHSRIGEAETLRMLGSSQDLADFLIKRRGKATRRQVAEVARIRLIRLNELEEPAKDQRVDLEALFAVLAVLTARAGVAIK